MRSTKDRRDNPTDPAFPLEDSDQELVMEDRRKRKERFDWFPGSSWFPASEGTESR